MNTQTEATGSCNCGKVRFSISTELTDVYICHCSICRKSTGGTGIAVTVVATSAFTLLGGEELIQSWAKPGHDWAKKFCANCGSPLPDSNDDTQTYIPVGLFDSGTEQLSIKHHLFVGSKAHWEEIGEIGKQHQEGFTQ